MNRIVRQVSVVTGAVWLGACTFLGDAPPVAPDLIPASPIAASSAPQPSAIVVFGDSLSDTGNAYVGSLHIRASSPPYYFGRFSNGPVWIELFAAHYALQAKAAIRGGSNYAIGGAKAGEGADGLGSQLQYYFWLHPFSRPDPRALYVVFGGGNDIRNALKYPDPAPALAQGALRIRCIIARLASRGALDFLVPNVPNRGRTPAARTRGTAAKEEAMTLAFNRGLDAALQDLPGRYPIHLVRVDFWAAAEEALVHPARWGFTNATDPCLRPGTGDDDPDDRICDDPQRHVFWDDIHPTLAGHKVLAAIAIAAWEGASGTPLPSSEVPPATLGPDPGDLIKEVTRLVREGVENAVGQGNP